MMLQSKALSRQIPWHGWPGVILPGLLLAVIFTFPPRAAGQQPARGVVEEFRNALKLDRGTFSKEAAVYREETLRKAADKVQSAGDLARVLLLQDWLFETDRAVLKIIGDRLEEKLKGDLSLDKSSPTRQIAAAILIRETIANTRTSKGVRSSPLIERFANLSSNLIDLIKSPRVGIEVRAAALSALGEIEPVFHRVNLDAPETIEPPSGAVESVLKEQMESPQPEVRRAAARALSEFTQGVMLFAEKYSTATEGSKQRAPSAAYRINSLASVVEIATSGLNNADAEVRRSCVDACRTVSVLTPQLIPIPNLTDRFPPEGRPWTKTERDKIEQRRREVMALRSQLTPLLEAFQKAVPTLAQVASANPDASVRVEANQVLENVAFGRQKLVKLEDRIPKEKNPPEQEARPEIKIPQVPEVLSAPNDFQSAPPQPVPNRPVESVAVGRPVAFRPVETAQDSLAASLRKSLGTVQKSLTDPDKKVRLAAVDVLDRLGDDAAPALPALVQALGDSDKFVRWSAARVIGKLAPIQPSVAVPKLAEVTADRDLDVRLAALSALERYGPAATSAVNPYLGNAAIHGDAEARIAAMTTLQAIGADSAAVLPAVATNLKEQDPRLRRAACETLGAIGLQVAQAKPAVWKNMSPKVVAVLRHALSDDAPAVRRAASDALLKVLGK